MARADVDLGRVTWVRGNERGEHLSSSQQVRHGRRSTRFFFFFLFSIDYGDQRRGFWARARPVNRVWQTDFKRDVVEIIRR